MNADSKSPHLDCDSSALAPTSHPMRNPVKVITRSTLKVITDSTVSGHLPERSDAGVGLCRTIGVEFDDPLSPALDPGRGLRRPRPPPPRRGYRRRVAHERIYRRIDHDFGRNGPGTATLAPRPETGHGRAGIGRSRPSPAPRGLPDRRREAPSATERSILLCVDLILDQLVGGWSTVGLDLPHIPRAPAQLWEVRQADQSLSARLLPPLPTVAVDIMVAIPDPVDRAVVVDLVQLAALVFIGVTSVRQKTYN